MTTQVEINIPKTVINEGTQFDVTARFRTRSSATASTPTNANWKIYNVSQGAVVKDWTALAPASEISFTVAASLNDLDSNEGFNEKHQLLVAADLGLSTQVIQAVDYRVKNIRGYG